MALTKSTQCGELLAAACETGRLKVVKMLVNKGASLKLIGHSKEAVECSKNNLAIPEI